MKSRRWNTGLLLAAAFVLMLIAGCKPRTLEPEEARALLSEVRKARQEVALKGQVATNVRLADTQVEAEATVHRGAGRFQLEFTSGSVKGIKIIEQDGAVWQIAADGKAVRYLPRNPVDQMPFMSRDAVIEVSSDGRISGRPTDKLVIRPRGDTLARIEMWLDRANRFPLGLDRYSSEDVVVASTRYTSVDFSVSPPPVVELPATSDEVADAFQGHKIDKPKAVEVLSQTPLEPSYIPDGFAFQGHFLHERGRWSAVELRYSDGVRLLSVLQFKPRRGREDGFGSDRPGARSQVAREQASGDQIGQRPRSRRDERGAAEGTGRSAYTVPDADSRRSRRERDDRDGDARPPRPDGRRRTGEPGAVRRQRDDERGDDGHARGERRIEDRGRDGERPSGEWRQGRPMRSVLRGKIVRIQVDELSIVVSGDVSEDELNKVADSFRPASTSF